MTHGPQHPYSSYRSVGLAVSCREALFPTKHVNDAFWPEMAQEWLELTSYMSCTVAEGRGSP
jgi:hypothetical protein